LIKNKRRDEHEEGMKAVAVAVCLYRKIIFIRWKIHNCIITLELFVIICLSVGFGEGDKI
jgi:hypothetical protein